MAEMKVKNFSFPFSTNTFRVNSREDWEKIFNDFYYRVSDCSNIENIMFPTTIVMTGEYASCECTDEENCYCSGTKYTYYELNDFKNKMRNMIDEVK